MISTLSIQTSEGVDVLSEKTLAADGGNYSIRRKLRQLAERLLAMVGGRWRAAVTLRFGERPAFSTLVVSGAAGSSTATINGTVFSDAQHNSTGTLTVETGGCTEDDVFAVNGITFTAKDVPATDYEFATSSNTTTQATNIKNIINASLDAAVKGIVTATSLSAVVTIRAVTPGTDGDAITLTETGNLTKSGTTLANGAAAVNNEYDFKGSDIETATALAASINDSTTEGANPVKNVVRASNYAATIQCTSATAGTKLSICGVELTANVDGTEVGVFAVGGTDTQDATALKNAINKHPLLKERVTADSSTDTVTVRSLTPTPADPSVALVSGVIGTISGNLAPTATVCVSSLWKGTIGNCITLAGASGVTAGAARLAGGTLGTVVTM